MATRTRPARHVSYWLAMTSGGLFVGCLVLIALYASATPGRHLRYLGAGLLTGVAAFVATAGGCMRRPVGEVRDPPPSDATD